MSKTSSIKVKKSDSFRLNKGISIYDVINSIDENEKENLNRKIMITSEENKKIINYFQMPGLTNDDKRNYILICVICLILMFIIVAKTKLGSKIDKMEYSIILSKINTDFEEKGIVLEYIFITLSNLNEYFSSNYIIVMLIVYLYLIFRKEISLNFVLNGYFIYFNNLLLQVLFSSRRPFWDFEFDFLDECDLSYSFPNRFVFLTTTVYFLFIFNKLRKNKLSTKLRIKIFLIWILLLGYISLLKIVNKQIYIYQLLLSIFMNLSYIIFTISMRFIKDLNNKALNKSSTLRQLRLYIFFFCFIMNTLLGILLSGIDDNSYNKQIDFINQYNICSDSLNDFVYLRFGTKKQLIDFAMLNSILGLIYGLKVKKKHISRWKKILLRCLCIIITIGILFFISFIEFLVGNNFLFYFLYAAVSAIVTFVNTIVFCKY